MASIYWLASYPKSGNTWIRIFLSNYLSDLAEPVNINMLDVGGIASTRAWFDEWVGVEASSFEDNVIERLRPSVYRCMAREEKKTLYIKVHDAWKRTDIGEGLFPADVTGGVVYILRNPLDMAASCAHHWGISLEQAVLNLCNSEFAFCQPSDRMAKQLFQYLGSWSSHVCSWIDDSQLPILLVRYEDLKQHLEVYFGEIVKFCNLQFDQERVSRAMAFSSFTEVQSQEKKNDFRERLIRAPGPFFRRGQVGSWREELPEHLVQRLIDAHGETMKRFGYLDEKYQPL